MNKQHNNRYLGQPENEIWFYDKDKPYYWLTNFYSSPIKSKLPIQFFDIEDREVDFPSKRDLLDENGKIPAGWKRFYCSKFMVWNGRHGEVIRSKEGQGDEIKFKTAEHLFQAFKFTDWVELKACLGYGNNEKDGIIPRQNAVADRIKKIIDAPGPSQAREIANRKFSAPSHGLGGSINGTIRSDWHSKYYLDIENDNNPRVECPKITTTPMKVRAMRFAVREKFTQNAELKEKLWQTGNKELVEHSPHDNFWGDGGNGSGQNWLGKILMEIRQEIINEKGKCPSVVDESEISHDRDREDAENRNKKILIEKNIQEIHAKLQVAKVSLEQGNKILGDAWEINYQINWMTSSREQIENAKKEALEKISEWVTRSKDPERDDPNQDNPSKNKKPDGPGDPNKKRPEDRKIPVPPSPVENDRIKGELNDASETNNSDDIFNSLKNNQEDIVNSTDEDLQKQAKILEDKLNKLDKEKSIRIIKGQIQTVLEQEKIKGYDLPVPIQQKYSELNNNNNNNNTIRDEIVQEVGKISLNKLIVFLEQALSENNKTEIKNKEQDLRNFVDSEVSYRKQAVQDYQEKINWLFREAQQKLSLNENSNDSPFFRLDNPLLYGFGIAIVGAVIVLRKLRLKRV